MNKKTIVIECQSCGGTGLYKGVAERGDCAVVCYMCKGTGKTTFTYKEFTGRKLRDGVKRVFARSVGYAHSDKDFTTKEGETIRFSEGGCTYQEWLRGEEPKPVKDLYCPYLWENKGVGNEPCSRCNKGCIGLGLISSCDFYEDKANCWKEYEAKNNH